ncbi:MAG: hypothetical protein U0Y68_15935 [Blastocatellia bacterium]
MNKRPPSSTAFVHCRGDRGAAIVVAGRHDEMYLGGDYAVIWPAAIGSLICSGP